MDGALLDEMGAAFDPAVRSDPFCVFLDDLYACGKPSYTVDFSRETMEVWTALHQEVSQFTCLKGRFCLTDGAADLSCRSWERSSLPACVCRAAYGRTLPDSRTESLCC